MPEHLLGPHVVGTRVVVRRLLAGETGPSGGPAFTDLLGVCTSWADGIAVIELASGEAVRVPISEIVSGKPVPPRPSVRLRVSAREAELHTAALEPGVVTDWLGEWQLNHEPSPVGRVRGRFNSALAMGDPGMSLAEAITQVRSHFATIDRLPLLRLEQGSEVESVAVEAGWVPVTSKDSLLMLAPTAQLARRLRGRVAPGTPGVPGATQPHLETDGPRATVDLSGRARGEAGLDGDWLGLHGLLVDPDHRRQGLARAVLAGLVSWGAEQGARTVWLHVEITNAPARALYDSLGFIEHHRMRYYSPPEE